MPSSKRKFTFRRHDLKDYVLIVFLLLLLPLIAYAAFTTTRTRQKAASNAPELLITGPIWENRVPLANGQAKVTVTAAAGQYEKTVNTDGTGNFTIIIPGFLNYLETTGGTAGSMHVTKYYAGTSTVEKTYSMSMTFYKVGTSIRVKMPYNAVINEYYLPRTDPPGGNAIGFDFAKGLYSPTGYDVGVPPLKLNPSKSSVSAGETVAFTWERLGIFTSPGLCMIGIAPPQGGPSPILTSGLTGSWTSGPIASTTTFQLVCGDGSEGGMIQKTVTVGGQPPTPPTQPVPTTGCETGINTVGYFNVDGSGNPLPASKVRVVNDVLQICVNGAVREKTDGFRLYINRPIEYKYRDAAQSRAVADNPDVVMGGSDIIARDGSSYCTQPSATTAGGATLLGIPLSRLRQGLNDINIFPSAAVGSEGQKPSCKVTVQYSYSGNPGTPPPSACKSGEIAGMNAILSQGTGKSPSSSVSIGWTYSGAITPTAFTVTRFNKGAAYGTTIATVGASERSATDTNPPVGNTFYYKVSARTNVPYAEICSNAVNLIIDRPTNELAYDAQGTLGTVTGGTTCTIQGWARDQDAPTQPIDVHVYQDGRYGTTAGKYLTAAVADIARSDLSGTWGADQSNHGFKISLPASLKDGKTHQLYVYAINKSGTPGNVAEMWGSPKSITCGATTPPSTLVWVTFKARSENYNTTVKPEITLMTSTSTTPLAKATISSGTLTSYALQIPSSVLPQSLRLAYLNDRYAVVNGVVQDSNVYVEDVRVNNMTYPNLTADGCQWNRKVGAGIYMACNGKITIAQ